MWIFKTKPFARFARRERIVDHSLWEAVERAGKGLIDADLGGGVMWKYRRWRPGRPEEHRRSVARRRQEDHKGRCSRNSD